MLILAEKELVKSYRGFSGAYRVVTGVLDG